MREERLKEAHDKRSDVFREEVFPEKNAYTVKVYYPF